MKRQIGHEWHVCQCIGVILRVGGISSPCQHMHDSCAQLNGRSAQLPARHDHLRHTLVTPDLQREGRTVSVSGISLRSPRSHVRSQGLTWRSLRAPRRLERRYTVRALGDVLNKSTTHAESAVQTSAHRGRRKVRKRRKHAAKTVQRPEPSIAHNHWHVTIVSVRCGH